jgi:hypothetical protein
VAILRPPEPNSRPMVTINLFPILCIFFFLHDFACKITKKISYMQNIQEK